MNSSETPLCQRCGRPLTNHDRAADGMGYRCRSKEPHRRRIRLLAVQANGECHYSLYSLTQAGKAHKYEVRVNFEDGTFSCTCPDYKYRGATCKHIRRACDYEARNRERMVA